MTKRKRSWAEMTPRQRQVVSVGAVLQMALQFAALRDLRRRQPAEVKGPRWAWVAATFVNTLGPMAYFVFGRRRHTVV